VRKVDGIFVMLVLAAIYMALSGGNILPVVPAVKASSVTYVYEKDSGGVPGFVRSGLNRLNRLTPPVLATEYEDDAVNGLGEVPSQYRVAAKAAREAGEPAFVVQSGDQVLKVAKDLKTEQAVLEVVQ